MGMDHRLNVGPGQKGFAMHLDLYAQSQIRGKVFSGKSDNRNLIGTEIRFVEFRWGNAEKVFGKTEADIPSAGSGKPAIV